MDGHLPVLALGMLALGTDSYVITGVSPQIARAFEAGVGVAGRMTTVCSVSFAPLSPAVAALAAMVRRSYLLLSGIAVFVLAEQGTATAPSLGVALLTRAVAGLRAAMVSPTATASVS